MTKEGRWAVLCSRKLILTVLSHLRPAYMLQPKFGFIFDILFPFILSHHPPSIQ